MSSLLKIKDDLKFYGGLVTLTKAVKAVAILQYHTLEKYISSFEKYLETIKGFFELIDLRNLQHPFVTIEERPTAAIAVTSEAGLLGGLNNRVMYTALDYLKDKDDKLIIIGYQGQSIAMAEHIRFKGFPSIIDEKRYPQAMEVRNYVFEEVINRRIGVLKIVYPHPISIVAHRIAILDIFPCTAWCRDATAEPVNINSQDMIFESNVESMIEYLSYLWVGQKIYEIFGYSRLAELSARITHLEGCTQKIEEIEKQLRIKYHKARHQIIDQQMRELFSARALYAK